MPRTHSGNIYAFRTVRPLELVGACRADDYSWGQWTLHTVSRVFDSVGTGLRSLFSPSMHDPAIRRLRAGIIAPRDRFAAALFSVLTPLWIGVDALLLEASLCRRLAVGRVVAGLAFASLAMFGAKGRSTATPYTTLGCLFAVPLAFFVFAADAFPSGGIDHEGVFLATAYIFLPFVVIAGLSLFPLTALECAALAIPVLAVTVTAALMPESAFGLVLDAGMGWLLALVAAVASLAAMSQVQSLIAFVQESSRDGLTRGAIA